MNKREKVKEVKQLLGEGLGRRRIAKELGTTEWEIRQIIKDIVKSLPQPEEKQEKTKVKIGHTNHLVSIPLASKSTTVTITSNIEEQDIPTKIYTRDITTKVAVLSDIHYPYEDSNCCTLAREFLKDYKPDIIVFNGDVADCYAVSRYEKSLKKKMNIQEEYDYTKARLQEWVDDFSNCDFYYLEGNHEARAGRLIKTQAPALEALRNINFQENLDLEGMGIKWIPDHQDLYIGNLLFYHGRQIRKAAGQSAKAHFEQYGCSILIGHVHRLAIAYKRNKLGTHTMIENGCLADFDVEYARYPDWHHGFTTLEFDGEDFAARQHAIIGYKLIADGKVYKI